MLNKILFSSGYADIAHQNRLKKIICFYLYLNELKMVNKTRDID